MARTYRRSSVVIVAALTVALIMILPVVVGCSSSYKSKVKDVIAELQVVQDEVLGDSEESDDAVPDGVDEEKLSPREQYVVGLESLRQDVTEMSRAVASAREDLEILVPSEAKSLTFHEEYLRLLGEYGEALADYSGLLEYQKIAVRKLGQVVPDTSETEGLWVEFLGFEGGGIDAANIDEVAVAAERAAGLVAGIWEDWIAIATPPGAVAEAHDTFGGELEDVAEEFEKLAQAAKEAADSGSRKDLNEVKALYSFAIDTLDALAEAMDAWWEPVDAAYMSGAYGLADLQDELDALEATADGL